ADRFARAFPRVAVVATLHVAAVFPATTRVVRELLGARSPLIYTAPSTSAAESYGIGVQVIGNGVDVDAIEPVLTAPSDRRLIWAGRRSKEKGLEAALQIAR